MRTNHGWIVVDEPAPGMNGRVYVEYINAGGRRDRAEMGYGNSGCTKGIEWWDKKLGTSIKLEPLMKGCFRVYTETVTADAEAKLHALQRVVKYAVNRLDSSGKEPQVAADLSVQLVATGYDEKTNPPSHVVTTFERG